VNKEKIQMKCENWAKEEKIHKCPHLEDTMYFFGIKYSSKEE
jgi:hypothetical protein